MPSRSRRDFCSAVGSVTLADGDSINFATGQKGRFTGGDLYYLSSPAKFWANNVGQRGVVSLGDIGPAVLANVMVPAAGYTRQGADAVLGHTGVALLGTDVAAQYTVFRVTEITATSITLSYQVITHSSPALGFIAATLYATLAGLSVPTQRTLIMLAAWLFTRAVAREAPPFHSFALALLLVLALDPFAPLSPVAPCAPFAPVEP